jgi:hypothetical protein
MEGLRVMRMLLLRIIALLALALFIALIARPRDSSLSVEEINRRTLKAAATIDHFHRRREGAARLIGPSPVVDSGPDKRFGTSDNIRETFLLVWQYG